MQEVVEIVNRNLFSAVQEGNLEAVQLLTISLLQSTCLETWDPGFDLICLALRNNYKDIAKFLITQGFRVSSSRTKVTALHVAVLYADLDIIDLLVKKGICPLTQDVELMTPFHLLANRITDAECRKVLKYFLSKGINLYSLHEKDHFTLGHFAAMHGNENFIKLLKNRKFNLNTQAKRGLTPLHVAIINNQNAVVSLLLKLGVDFEIRNADHLTPLRLSVKSHNVTAVQLILNYTLRFRKNNYRKQFGSFLLYCAVITGDNEKVKAFLKAGANANLYVKMTGKTPLHVAVENEFEEIVHLILEHNADRNLRQHQGENRQGDIPLHMATKKRNMTIVKKLLDHPLDDPNRYISSIFTPGSDNVTPCHIAIERNYGEIVDFYLDKGVYYFSERENQLPLLTILVRNAPLGILTLFLKNYVFYEKLKEKDFQNLVLATVESKNTEAFLVLCDIILQGNNLLTSYIALYTAVFFGIERIARYLLVQNVNPNVSAQYCLPPLHAAAQQNRSIIFKILLDYSAEINPTWNTTEYFSTLLHAAAFGGSDEIVEIILQKGVNVNARLRSKPDIHWNSEIHYIFIGGNYPICDICTSGFKIGYTPLHFAAEKGQESIVNRLIRHGADINAKSNNSSTPLMLAVQNEYVEVVRSLLKAGADIQVPENLTPILNRAITSKNPAIVELLLIYNAPVNIIGKHFFSSRTDQGFTPLHIAVSESTAEVVEILLKSNAQIDVETEQDLPLHLAIEEGDEEIIIKLAKYGASFKSQCSKGLSPFLHAVKASQLDVLRFLLWRKVSFERITPEGTSLLLFTIENKVSISMFKFLLSCGIIEEEKHNNPCLLYDILKKTDKIPILRRRQKKKPGKNKRNGELYAREERKNWILRALLQFDWNPDTWSKSNQESILHFAVRDERSSAVDILLNFGVDINVVDGEGFTPFHYAASQVERISLIVLDKPEDTEYWEPSGMEIITRSLISTIVRLLMTDREVNEQNLSIFRGRPFLCEYFNHCCDEIQKLKVTKISGNITFFNLIDASDKKLLRYARNKEVKKKTRLGFHKQFPIYETFLRNRLQRFIEKNELVEKGIMFFAKIRRLDVPHFIMLRVLENFSSAMLRIIDHA